MAPPDRTLRHLVVDLAARQPDDIASVLDQLDAPQRKIVEGMLRELSNFGFGQDAPHASEDIDARRLSPWLMERIQSDQADSTMTVAGRQALRECALRLYAAPMPQKRQSKSLFGWLFAKQAII